MRATALLFIHRTDVEIDPDVWLAARLTFGRRYWRLTAQLAITAGIIASSGPHGFLTRVVTDVSSVLARRPWPAEGDPGLLLIAVVMAVTAPLEVLRLLQLEQRGVFNHTRMCGRPPSRVLAAFLGVYASVPFVMSAVLLTVNAIRFGGGFGVVWVMLLLTLIVLDLALVGFSLLGQAAQLPLIIATYLVLGTPLYLGWIADVTVRRPHAIAALAALIALPVAVRMACTRIVRPAERRDRPAWTSPASMLAWAVPHAGPPELVCRLRRSTIQHARFFEVVAGLFLAALMIATYGRAAGWSRAATLGSVVLMNLLPLIVVLFGAIAVGTTARAELQSGAFDLVRLTPQKPEAIAVGWYAGLSLPFWMAALGIPLILRFAAPDMFGMSPRAGAAPWWRSPILWAVLACPAMLVPAVALVEPFQRRLPSTYFVYGCAAFYALLGMTGAPPPTSELRAAHPIASEIADVTGHMPTLIGEGLSLRAVVVLFALATITMLGVVAGRIRRPDGPALAGPAVAAALLALAWSWRLLSAGMYPSVVAAMVPLVASFVGEERRVPSPPWVRIGVAMAAAIASVASVAMSLGVDAPLALTSAVTGALALGAAILGHELLYRWTILTLGLPVLLTMGIRSFDRPPVLPAAAAFIVLGIAHTAWRRHADRLARFL